MFFPSFPPRSEQDHSNSERKEALILFFHIHWLKIFLLIDFCGKGIAGENKFWYEVKAQNILYFYENG